MMLTPEQLRELRSKVAFWSELKRKDAISLFDHIEAQQARIAEWETLRDPNVLHANLLRGIPAKLSADQLLHIAGDKYQAMAARIAELEAKAGAGNEWRRAHDDLLASLNKANGRIAELDGLLQSASNHCNATANERNDLEAQYASLLSLLADIRIACGDNGKRMQDELVAYISELAQDKARLDSGCIKTRERDDFGQEYDRLSNGIDLRAAIDAARVENGDACTRC